MCGLAGLIDGAGLPQRGSALLRRMLATIIHRGPDDDGQWLECGVALGHRRLAIVELSSLGHQPMHSTSGRYVIAFNGEVYNHQALRRDLERKGDSFRGHSDTEVLLALIERHGLEGALHLCVGMFAIALWDRRERVLQLARDRFGEKPLYFGRAGEDFVFASELSAITAHPDFDPVPSTVALTQVVRRGYVGSAQCIYHSLQQVPPGTIVKVLPGDASGRWQIDETRFWDPLQVARQSRMSPFTGSFDEAVNEFERLLAGAVALQLQADVPVGAFLSGGIDSSLVAAFMQQASGGRVRSYSIGFDRPAFNEAEHAKAVAKHLGTAHTEWYVDEQEALALVPKLGAIFGEPFADASQIPTLILARLVRSDVTVALSGDGADELFGGYPKYLRGARLNRTPARAMLARALHSADRAVTSLTKRMPRSLVAQTRWHTVGSAAALFGASSRESLASAVGDLNHWPERYLSPHLTCAASRAHAEHLTNDDLTDMSFERLAMLQDICSYLPADILVKVDRATMAASLESRAPFLDHRIFAFAASLPDEFLFEGAQGKRLLRKSLYRHIPRDLVDRPKQGFQVPLGEWLRGALKPWAADLLTSSAAAGCLNVERCMALLQQHWSGPHDLSSRIWPLLMIANWAEGRHSSALRTGVSCK